MKGNFLVGHSLTIGFFNVISFNLSTTILDISYDVLDNNENLLHQLSAQLGLPSYLEEDPFSHLVQPVDKVIPNMDMQEMNKVPDINMPDINTLPHTGKREDTTLNF